MLFRILFFCSAALIVSPLSASAQLPQCRTYTFAALIGLIDIRCSDRMETTEAGVRLYEQLVLAGRKSVAECSQLGARTEEALVHLGHMIASGMIDKIAGTSPTAPSTEQVISRQCAALARLLNDLSPRNPLYRRK